MKMLSVAFNTVLTVAGLGSLYYIFDPNFSIVERLLLTYIVFMCVFALYLNYRFRNNQF